MNNINPVFQALSGIDERHIPVKHPVKKLRIALIAAAAAALALLVGFVGTSGGKHRFSFDTGNRNSRGFDLDLTPQELTVPEEFMPPLGEVFFSGNVDILPSELFRKFGISPLITENFSETDELPFVDIFMPDGAVEDVNFTYELYDKNIKETVYFDVTCFANPDRMTYRSHIGYLPGEPTEIVTLSSGSLCLLTGSEAVFSYNGAVYYVRLPYEYDEPDHFGELPESEKKRILAELIEAMPGIETVKQVLADLGIL